MILDLIFSILYFKIETIKMKYGQRFTKKLAQIDALVKPD